MPGRPELDLVEVERVKQQLSALTDQAYAEALADCVMDPDPFEQAAFRSPELAQRSLIAARYLIDNVNSQIRQRQDESKGAWGARAAHFRTRVGMERRILDAIVTGLRAQAGVLSNAPNPRARAMRRLAQLHPEEFLRLVREEQQADKERAAAAKEERKRLRREAKRPPNPG